MLQPLMERGRGILTQRCDQHQVGRASQLVFIRVALTAMSVWRKKNLGTIVTLSLFTFIINVATQKHGVWSVQLILLTSLE